MGRKRNRKKKDLMRAFRKLFKDFREPLDKEGYTDKEVEDETK